MEVYPLNTDFDVAEKIKLASEAFVFGHKRDFEHQTIVLKGFFKYNPLADHNDILYILFYLI